MLTKIMGILFSTALSIHVVAGVGALFVGLLAMGAKKKRGQHTQWGNIYFYLVSMVCLSALILSVLHWDQSSYLFFVSVFSFTFAFRGYKAAKYKKEGWLSNHIRGMLGSYIAMLTAFLVVSGHYIPGISQLPSMSLWLLPSLIGTPIIIFVRKKMTGATK